MMFAVEQDEHFTITFRDSFERTPQNRFLLATDGLFGRQRFAGGRVMDFVQRFGKVRRFASFLAKVLVNPVSNDPAEPGAQLGRLA
jgi:hypothetical protein